jgi:hypothetical protein
MLMKLPNRFHLDDPPSFLQVIIIPDQSGGITSPPSGLPAVDANIASTSQPCFQSVKTFQPFKFKANQTTRY